VVRWFIEVLSNRQKVHLTEEQLILLIQHHEGWTSDANNLNSMIIALRSAKTGAPMDQLNDLRRSSAYLKVMPTEVKYQLLPELDPAGFKLGVLAFSWNDPSFMVHVAPDGFGYSLGLRSGDTLISAGGKGLRPVGQPTPTKFKLFLKENLGRKIRVGVWRKVNYKMLIVQLPSAIPQ